MYGELFMKKLLFVLLILSSFPSHAIIFGKIFKNELVEAKPSLVPLRSGKYRPVLDITYKGYKSCEEKTNLLPFIPTMLINDAKNGELLLRPAPLGNLDVNSITFTIYTNKECYSKATGNGEKKIAISKKYDLYNSLYLGFSMFNHEKSKEEIKREYLVPAINNFLTGKLDIEINVQTFYEGDHDSRSENIYVFDLYDFRVDQ